MNRKLTQQEIDWLKQGLKTLENGTYNGGGKWIDGNTGKVKLLDKPISNNKYFEQINSLRVVSKCNCGDKDCHTIQFQHFETTNYRVIVSSSTVDERMLIISIDKDSDKLAELEIMTDVQNY